MTPKHDFSLPLIWHNYHYYAVIPPLSFLVGSPMLGCQSTIMGHQAGNNDGCDYWRNTHSTTNDIDRKNMLLLKSVFLQIFQRR